MAGTGSYDFSGDGGNAVSAKLKSPWSVFVNAIGEIFIADTDNDRIRKIATNGIITTIAGSGSSTSDGVIATTASLKKPTSVFISPANELFIAGMCFHNFINEF